MIENDINPADAPYAIIRIPTENHIITTVLTFSMFLEWFDEEKIAVKYDKANEINFL